MKWDGTDWLSAEESFRMDTQITVLRVLSLTKSSAGNKYLSKNSVLLIGGKLDLPTIGKASAVFFDGVGFTPYLSTKTASGDTGTLSQFFIEKQTHFAGGI